MRRKREGQEEGEKIERQDGEENRKTRGGGEK